MSTSIGEFLWGLVTGTLCHHEWEDKDVLSLHRGNNKRRIGTQYIQKCKHCGKLRHYTVRVDD